MSVPATYYERLGVDPDASESEIKTAFRERIKETHPDVSEDEAASDRTKQLIDAKTVLTDPAERERYDRLGHESYVSARHSELTEESHGNSTDATGARRRTSTTTKDRTESSTAESTASAGKRTGANSQTGSGRVSGATRATDREDGEETADGTSGYATNWYDSTRRQRSTVSADGSHRAWDADQAYAVSDSPGLFSPRELLTSHRTIALLGTTFFIYPVLLFGALFPAFPTAVNLTVAMCIVLVIAFMQSVPQVGILVFGTWTVLLPIILFGVVGVRIFSVQGILSLAAVSFPLGLSVLTWIAIGPMKR